MSNGCCFIVPPYVLEAMRKHADERARLAAARTLEATRMLMLRRMAITPDLPMSARYPGERRTICDAQYGSALPGKVIGTEGHRPRNDWEAQNAYDNSGIVYDFYERIFGRRSIDGHDMRMLSSVRYLEDFDNAFWDGTQMVYGTGDGVMFDDFVKALDVVGHELTHGVTQMTCNLVYHGEPGALNESISDVFGSMIKQYHLKQDVHAADWLIGDTIMANKRVGKALRSMKAPGTAYDSEEMGGKDPQPAHYRDFDHSMDDEGGVHVNSGIPNHAFYLLAMELGGHSWDVAGQIWYEAITTDLGVRCSFSHFATRTRQVAERRFDANVVKAVGDAWGRVGL